MQETIKGMKRSMRVAEVSRQNLGEELTLMGWCHRQRDIGQIVFLTLRDRSGELQLVVDDDSPQGLLSKAKQVRSEFVLACRGVLRLRQDPNPDMPTGAYELHVHELRILSASETPPIYIDDDQVAKEDLRLEYRYLDLRRPRMQENLRIRSEVAFQTRKWFHDHGFYDIETPTFIRSTPEGARDYLVPSRMYHGQFFALPQSPQLYKQLLMVAGMDRYMQLARCYRDEDLRADRQPEFTQIDMEMTFVTEEDVFQIMEEYVPSLFKTVLDVELTTPFPRMTWHQAMARYGTDKPDCRFGLEIHDVSDLAQASGFQVFASCVEQGGSVQCIAIPAGSDLKRRQLDAYTDLAKENGAKGLVWMSYEDPLRGSAAKFLDENFMRQVADRCGADKGDLFLFVADEQRRACEVLGRLRLQVAADRELIPTADWYPLWIVHFPMFEYSEEEQRLVASHHPFTMPVAEDLADPHKDPVDWLANAYDLVLNGYELGSGSMRIYDQELQERIFELIGLSKEEAQERFGFLLKAFKYGVPPHGGIALGLDRLTMLMCHSDNIKEVIAFPKTQTSACLMAGCPTSVDDQQLADLGIALREQPHEA